MDTATTAFSGAAEQARMLAAGIHVPQLLELYLERIGRLDGQLNAYRTVRVDGARAEAVTPSVASTPANDSRFSVSPSRSKTTSMSPAR